MTKEIFNSQKLILIMLFVTICLFLIPVILYGPHESSLVLNQYHNPIADQFFKWITRFGEFAFIAPVIVLLFIVRRRVWAITVGVNSLITLVFTYCAKHYIFPHTKRPLGYFGDLPTIHLVDGVNVHHHDTFPSGHTMAAFAVFMFLAFNMKGWAKHLCLLIAFCVGASRIYLFQHFALDVISGAMMGSVIAFFAHSVTMMAGTPFQFRFRWKKGGKKTTRGQWAPEV